MTVLNAADDQDCTPAQILELLGGWGHRRWEGSVDRERNAGVANFLDETGLLCWGEEPAPTNGRANAWATVLSDHFHRLAKGIIPDALFDHVHDFSYRGVEFYARVSFPYVGRGIGRDGVQVAQLPEVALNLQRRGIVLRCIVHGWWNDRTVGFFFYPSDARFERRLPGFVRPSAKHRRARSCDRKSLKGACHG